MPCGADFARRKFQPENTRHARFGEECRDIHPDLALEEGKAPPAHCITVHFGTPRRPTGSTDDGTIFFGDDLDTQLNFGFADISPPLLAREEKDGHAGTQR